ncbi:MAG TPA: glycosyltransferase [Gaiella sp.]|uniref:glycosyltransferase n=1 Tax=Gaiella sp. TaxID=2663207 RepID=UPI002D807F50|nr:glycosyltransferase [Gaiella sp.]HET9289198.1 glycosyltransferase [Gaiella sp.]
MGPRLRILFATPAYWPAHAFGGPVVVARELVSRLAARGHDVEVVTTTLTEVRRRSGRRTRVEPVDGARVTYLGTPLRYRWMGITPTLPLVLRRLERPDIAHLIGFRDPVTTGVAAWCRARRIPYVFEPVGMFRPRLRKVRLKRVFDSTLTRGVASAAGAVIVSSPRERQDVVASGIDPARVRVRGNAFPEPPPAGGVDPLRGIVPDGAPVVLYVGRIAAEKGVEHLLEAARRLTDVHVVLVGPDDRHGTMAGVDTALADPATAGRVHVLPPSAGPPFDLYRRADVFVLASGGENFGLVAAEAAAVGTPVIVSDRTGVASSFAEGEALVVPYEPDATVIAIDSVLHDEALRAALAAGALRAAGRSSWDAVVDGQLAIYDEALGARRRLC